MNKLFLTSILSLLLASQTSIVALHPNSIVYIPYKLLFGGLSGFRFQSAALVAPFYTLLCGTTIYATYIVNKETKQTKGNTKKSIIIPQHIPEASNPNTLNTHAFDDPYEAPTQEEWDALKQETKN